MEVSKIPQVEFFKKKEPSIEFEILALEDLLSRKNRLPFQLEHPHRVQFYHILYITAGEGIHHIDFRPYSFSPGSLLFISQGQVHSFEVRPDIQGYMVVFTAEYLQKNLIHSDIVSFYRLYNYHLHEPVIQPQETSGEDFHSIFKEIKMEYGCPDRFANEEILRLLLKILLLKIERIKPTILAEQKNVEWLAQFDHLREYLGKHYTSTRSVRDYALMLKISPKHLNTICKSVSGATAKQCIDNFLILEVKRVLATSGSSVQEMSYAFGFDEPTNFVKFFKKHAGQSPTQFRAAFTKSPQV